MSTKQCSPVSGCGLVKDLLEFNKHSRRKDGRQDICRACDNAACRARQQRIKDGEHIARSHAEVLEDSRIRFDAQLAELGEERVGDWHGTQTATAIRCPYGHVTERYPYDSFSHGYGCKVCNQTGGINLRTLGRSVDGALAPRWLYVIRFPDGRWKVGLGTDSRVYKHTCESNGGGVVIYQTLTTKAAAYVIEQRVLKDDLRKFNFDKALIPEHYQGRTEFLCIDPTHYIKTLEHRVPLAADPDAADWHVDFVNNIVADEVERKQHEAQQMVPG